MNNEAEINKLKAKIEKTEKKMEQSEKEYQEKLGKAKREQEENRPGRGGAKTSIGALLANRQRKNNETMKKAEEHYFND